MTLLAIDHEDPGVTLDDVKEFAAIVEDASLRVPVLYSGHLLKEQLGDDHDPYLAHMRLWLAQYCLPPPSWPTATWPHWWLWQYTEEGVCPGIASPTDLSVYQSSLVTDPDQSDMTIVLEWSGVRATRIS